VAYCSHFIHRTDENSTLAHAFQYDLMTILDSGLLFGPPCRTVNVLNVLGSDTVLQLPSKISERVKFNAQPATMIIGEFGGKATLEKTQFLSGARRRVYLCRQVKR